LKGKELTPVRFRKIQVIVLKLKRDPFPSPQGIFEMMLYVTANRLLMIFLFLV